MPELFLVVGWLWIHHVKKTFDGGRLNVWVF